MDIVNPLILGNTRTSVAVGRIRRKPACRDPSETRDVYVPCQVRTAGNRERSQYRHVFEPSDMLGVDGVIAWQDFVDSENVADFMENDGQ